MVLRDRCWQAAACAAALLAMSGCGTVGGGSSVPAVAASSNRSTTDFIGGVGSFALTSTAGVTSSVLSGTVGGTLVTGNGKAIAKATVVATDSSGATTSTVTGKNGAFSFTLAAGSYTVTATNPSTGAVATANVSVVAGVTVSLTLID